MGRWGARPSEASGSPFTSRVDSSLSAPRTPAPSRISPPRPPQQPRMHDELPLRPGKRPLHRAPHTRHHARGSGTLARQRTPAARGAAATRTRLCTPGQARYQLILPGASPRAAGRGGAGSRKWRPPASSRFARPNAATWSWCPRPHAAPPRRPRVPPPLLTTTVHRGTSPSPTKTRCRPACGEGRHSSTIFSSSVT